MTTHGNGFLEYALGLNMDMARELDE